MLVRVEGLPTASMAVTPSDSRRARSLRSMAADALDPGRAAAPRPARARWPGRSRRRRASTLRRSRRSARPSQLACAPARCGACSWRSRRGALPARLALGGLLLGARPARSSSRSTCDCSAGRVSSSAMRSSARVRGGFAGGVPRAGCAWLAVGVAPGPPGLPGHWGAVRAIVHAYRWSTSSFMRPRT